MGDAPFHLELVIDLGQGDPLVGFRVVQEMLAPVGEGSVVVVKALAGILRQDGIDKALAELFLDLGEEEEQDHSLALLGLAALDEPVLLQIKQELKDPKLPPAVRINLATALLELGDGSEALKVYREILQKNAQDLGNTMRIKVGKDQDEMIAATTQMAVLAARLNQAETNRLYQYILENPAAESVNFLEQIQILKHNLQRMNSEPVSFSYNLNGKTNHVSLKNGETFRITLSPRDLSRIKFSNIRGKVGVMTRYSQPYSKDQSVSGEGLSLSRRYQVNGVKTNSIKRSDLVKVVLTVTIKDLAPGGWYEVTDVLPAGLAYVPRPYDYGVSEKELSRWSYPTEVKGRATQLGFSLEGAEIIDMGVTARILEKSGAWYAYNGEKIGQGRDNAREFLRENPELAREIENKVRDSLGIALMPTDGVVPGPQEKEKAK